MKAIISAGSALNILSDWAHINRWRESTLSARMAIPWLKRMSLLLASRDAPRGLIRQDPLNFEPTVAVGTKLCDIPTIATKGATMAQAIMDPEKVRRFAEELQRFNTDLDNRLVLLMARFAALGDTWQDQEHEKFSEEFKQAMKALKKFVEASKVHTPYLLRKAQRIEEYLNQR
ncbi:MAG TPA: WXG100 family type VII secretion target [Verrucomicrobiae bacterium]|jgi:uncharacterized protein YukE